MAIWPCRADARTRQGCASFLHPRFHFQSFALSLDARPEDYAAADSGNTFPASSEPFPHLRPSSRHRLPLNPHSASHSPKLASENLQFSIFLLRVLDLSGSSAVKREVDDFQERVVHVVQIFSEYQDDLLQ